MSGVKNELRIVGGIVLFVLVAAGLMMITRHSRQTITLNTTEPTILLPTAAVSTTPMQKSNQKQYAQFPGVLPNDQWENKLVTIHTAKGDIVIKMLPDAPKAASNFVFLAHDHFYDGLTFHRVEPGFVIQGGDPNGNGTGGPGYQFADEPVTRKYTRGIVAMANAGPNTNGSQFFIMLADTPLPPQYTIFGEVVSGMDVVDAIKVGDVMQTVQVAP